MQITRVSFGLQNFVRIFPYSWVLLRNPYNIYIYIYHINCGVIQGFPALRKAVTTHVKKYRIFSRVLI